jgi:PAS domain S-box-containing protein
VPDERHPESGRRPASRQENLVAAEPLRVLLVEDEPAHSELARRAFDARGGTFEVEVAETIEAARACLSAAPPPDLVIADWLLPDGEGLDLLRGGAAGAAPPVVIMTSHGSERVAVESMRAGAADYVVKSEVTLADLPHVVERAIRQKRIEDTLGDIAAGTTAVQGEGLFQSLVLRLAHALRARYASVAEVVGSARVRTLARVVDGSLVPNVVYPLAGTPCEGVLDGTVRLVRQGAAQLFPEDEDLRRLKAESYVGSVLRASTGEVLGLVNAVHDRPLDEAVQPEAVVQVFASRAAAELERLRAEREIEGQRVFAESLLDMVASLVIVVDPEGRIVRFNRACEQISGWTEEELRGRHFWEVLRPPEAREGVSRFFRHDPSREALPPTWDATWVTRSGERRLISWTNRPVFDETGAVTYVIGTGVDVTESRRMDAALHRAAVEWRETFDGLPIGVLVVDSEGRIVRANRTAVAISGRSSWADLIESPLCDSGLGEPWAALSALVQASRARGASPPREVVDPATRHTWVVSASPLAAEGEGSGRLVLNFQDVTETARLKEQLRQSETMAEIGSIVAGVAHEVRNPLFSISATLDAFESRFGKTEGYERYLGVLRAEIVRLTTLMKDLLDFGRPSRPDFAECRMEDIVATAVLACDPLARRKSVQVSWPQQPVLPAVLVDRARITQVVQNLVENAIHFSPTGGRVEITLQSTADEEGEWVECVVRDSGPGFTPVDVPRLFEPFFTRRRGGTGLGLSIVKRIVYDHGGDVTAENHHGGGAIVKVRLRRAPS